MTRKQKQIYKEHLAAMKKLRRESPEARRIRINESKKFRPAVFQSKKKKLLQKTAVREEGSPFD